MAKTFQIIWLGSVAVSVSGAEVISENASKALIEKIEKNG
jgi:hypothetical protein